MGREGVQEKSKGRKLGRERDLKGKIVGRENRTTVKGGRWKKKVRN
jgi:hypothetical protein